MGKYIHYFTAVTDFNTARSENYEEPWVSLTEESEIFDVDYNKSEKELLKEMPFTFEITSGSGVIAFNTGDLDSRISYSKDNGQTWQSLPNLDVVEGTEYSIPVDSGDVVQVKTQVLNHPDFLALQEFDESISFKVKGNIMSLVDGENFATMTSFPEGFERMFGNGFFAGCSGLTDASELILPVTTLAVACYYGMFQGCTNLTTAPSILPATTLANACYKNMFDGCTSLTTAPELPATTLAGYCYSAMFQNCTSLTTAPELPATTLVDTCYAYMFYNCTSLNYIKCLATDISAEDCTSNWVDGVASTGTFVGNPNMDENFGWWHGTDGVPENWNTVDVVWYSHPR